MKKSRSFRYWAGRVLWTFAALQTAAFLVVLLSTNLFSRVYDQGYSAFTATVKQRANEIQFKMNETRGSFLTVSKELSQEITSCLDEVGENAAAMSRETTIQVLDIATRELVSYLDVTADISGVFLFLDENASSRPGIYIRDNSTSGRNTNSKILVRGPSDISKQYNYQLDYLWQPTQNFLTLEAAGDSDFYDKPMAAVREAMDKQGDIYYWSRPFSLNKGQPRGITLSIALVDDNGALFGVCGFEMSEQMLRRNLPYAEMGESSGIYLISSPELARFPEHRITSGPFADQLLLEGGLKETTVANSQFSLTTVENTLTMLPKYLCVQQNLQLYSRGSAFEEEEWSLYGLFGKQKVEHYSNSFIATILYAQFLAIFMCVIALLLYTNKKMKPLAALANSIDTMDAEQLQEVRLPAIRVTEAEKIYGAIRRLGEEVTASNARMDLVANMGGMIVGSFEETQEAVRLSASMSRLLSLPPETRALPKDQWIQLRESLTDVPLVGQEQAFSLIQGQETRYLCFRDKAEGTGGVLIDITEEIKRQKQEEYRRTHHALTGLLNRIAFTQHLHNLLSGGTIKAGVMLLIHLDNTSEINEQFGWDAGDQYLQLMAGALREFEEIGGIVAHIAGDQFAAFIPGSELLFNWSLKKIITPKLEAFSLKSFTLPNGKEKRLRFSTGVSWLPGDTQEAEVLIRYAEFAVRAIKHSIKGTMGEFDIDAYKRDINRHNSSELLNEIIESESIRYKLQPIVDAKTAEVMGYELLMRSDILGVRAPEDILKLARAQSKMYQIEQLCMKKLGELLADSVKLLAGKRIFYNTEAAILLKEEDWTELVRHHGSYFGQVVVEINDSALAGKEASQIKIERFRSIGCQVALDNYGAGYSNEAVLIEVRPEYIKVDRTLIRDIQADEGKQHFVKSLVSYSTIKNQRVVAEGVETYEEMYCLMALGVDYLQGFYLGHPNFNITETTDVIRGQILEIRGILEK